MKRTTFALIITVLAATALASGDFGRHPGYRWGRANCGPMTGGQRSAVNCANCCRLGVMRGRLDIEGLYACLRFCDAVQWPLWGGE